MSDTDSPEIGSGGDAALDHDQSVAAIEGVLLGSGKEKADNPKNAKADEIEDEVVDPFDDAGDEPEDIEEVETDGEVEEDDDAPGEVKSKDVADDAKVKLSDGTEISVAELKKGFMFQKTFTEKTTALARERDAFYQERQTFDSERTQIAQYANALAEQRDIIEAMAKELLPQKPSRDLLERDPFEYMHQEALYNERMDMFQNLVNHKQMDEQRRQYEEQQEAAKRAAEYQKVISQEIAKLVEKVPVIKDKKAFDGFRADALKYAVEVYGYTKEELGSIADHRALHVLYDLISSRKELAKIKREAKSQSGNKQAPKIAGKQRMDRSEVAKRDYAAAKARLLRTGSADDAVAALEKLL